MRDTTPNGRSRQVRRAEQRRVDKALAQAERRRQRALAGRPPLGAFKREFLDRLTQIPRRRENDRLDRRAPPCLVERANAQHAAEVAARAADLLAWLGAKRRRRHS